jgi:hypothetical protein
VLLHRKRALLLNRPMALFAAGEQLAPERALATAPTRPHLAISAWVDATAPPETGHAACRRQTFVAEIGDGSQGNSFQNIRTGAPDPFGAAVDLASCVLRADIRSRSRFGHRVEIR